MRHVATLLVAAWLAGCLGDGADDSDGEEPGVPPAGMDPALAFELAQRIGVGGDLETSVLVEGDTVLVCSHGGFWQPSPLWASTDGGATFARIDPQPNPIVSGDCDLAILDSGRWVIVYDTIASATIAWSDDEGASWSFNYGAALPIAVDRPWIHAGVGDRMYMTYSDVMAAEPALQMFAISEDGGETWLSHTPVNVAQPPDRLQSVMGRMVVFDDGQTIHVPLARSNIHTGGPVYLDVAISDDGGASWRTESVHGPYDAQGLILPSMARAGDRLYYTVPAPNGTLHDIGVMWNDGDGWDGPVTVATAVDLPGVLGPWIDGRSDGGASLAWVGHVEAGWSAFAVRVTPDLQTAGPIMLAEPTDRGQGIGHEFLMLDHDDAGRAHVAWVMDTEDGCDPAPNDVETRGSQCVWIAVETL